MRILYLVIALDVGGLEKVVVDLINGSKKYGIEPYLGCLFYEGKWASKAKVEGVWVGGLGDRGTALHKSSISIVLNLCKFLRKNNIDLIHSHNPKPHIFGVIASILTRIPIVHTKHGRNYPANPRWVWLSRQLSRFTTKIIAVSDNVAKVAVEIERVPPEKVMVIKNGVDIDKIPTDQNVRKRFEIPEDVFVVGSVGRFSPEKNYALLIRAFANFRNKTAKEKASPALLLVGDGPERTRLERLITELKIEKNAILPGMQEDVVSWLRCMDVFCLSSLSEGTSITLLEAGACGIPAVVTRVGGNSEIVINGETGLVVNSGDENEMAAAFRQLYSDGFMRQKAGRAILLRVEKMYSLERMVADYDRVYKSVKLRGGQGVLLR